MKIDENTPNRIGCGNTLSTRRKPSRKPPAPPPPPPRPIAMSISETWPANSMKASGQSTSRMRSMMRNSRAWSSALRTSTRPMK